MSEHGYRQALKVSGVNLRDVEHVPLSIEENYIGDDEASNRGTLWGGSTRTRRQKAEMFALIRVEVDAFYTSGSMGAYLAAMLGGHEVVNFGFCADRFARIGNQSPAALTVDRKLLREDPQLVARFLREIMRAATWAKTHKDECARILGRETGAPEEWVAPGYGPACNECMEVALHDEWVRALEVQKNFLLEAGFIAKNFSIRMDPESLKMALQMMEPEEAAAS